jgi:hypothetical protein
MVFGFGNGPGLLETRQIEDHLLLGIGDLEAGNEAWLISPYLTIDKLSSLRRQITEACKRGATVNIVVRDEPDQVNPAKSGLKDALSYGLNLYAFHRLHAKVYWFDDIFSIITSANLVDGSFEGSTEIGVITEPGSLHDKIRNWIAEVLEPGLKPISNKRPPRTTPGKPIPAMRTNTRTGSKGLCIRCGTAIPLNMERPYCLEHYRIWEQYRNPDYVEKVCHSCGKPGKPTMAKPVCYECFKKLAK